MTSHEEWCERERDLLKRIIAHWESGRLRTHERTATTPLTDTTAESLAYAKSQLSELEQHMADVAARSSSAP